MGMFDYVRCELPLPEEQDAVFQTKDTNQQYMMHHTLRADGRLILHDYDTELTPKAERPYPDTPDDNIQSMFGSIRKKAGTERDVDQNFDGDLRFYNETQYRATFRGGTCQEICQEKDGKWSKVWP